MNIFKIRTTWSNYELALLKACVASCYVSVGIYFHGYLEKYIVYFSGIFAVSLMAILYIWARKPKSLTRTPNYKK